MSDLNEPRDVQLGNSLRELPVPEHREHFWSNLATSLRRAAAEDDRGGDGATTKRKPSRAWAAIPAIAAVAAAIAIVVLVLPRDGDEPAPVAAPPVPGMVTATAVVTRGDTTTNYEIARAADGSFVETDTTTGATTAYDAKTRTIVSWTVAGGVTSARRERNVAPGRPDASPSSLVLDRGLEAFVVAAHESGRRTISDLVVDGRTSLRYAGSVTPNPLSAQAVNSVDAVVDAQTGVLRSLVRRASREEVERVNLRSFAVHAGIDRERFTVNIPAGAQVEEIDRGFETMDDEDVAVRRDVAGYTLAGAYEREGAGEPTGPEASNPPGRDVESYWYRSGWHHVVVTTRTGASGEDWEDPLGVEGIAVDPDRLDVEGLIGELILDPTTIPHAWARAGVDVLTSAGAASTDDLVALLEVARAL